jgi:cation:H+ antiporter
MDMNWAVDWPLPATITMFGIGALAILLMGVRITRLADRLADATGLGEAVFGAVLLGGTTSLAGIVTSVTAALANHPQLAVSNAVGGIAVQTAFLAIADLAYRRVNLEHAAASAENLLSGALLCGLLGLVLLAAHGPAWQMWSMHPVSFILFGGYLFGVRLASRAHQQPAWTPLMTRETKPDRPASARSGDHPVSNRRQWLAFCLLAAGVTLAGYLVAVSGIALVRSTGISETVVGGLFTAIATSLPELVTSIAAVRQGALTLAIGGIIGGNTFDVLFVALADAAYRPGSIYHAIDHEPLFVISLTIVMTSILLLGMLHREKRGVGNIGFEGAMILLLYTGGFSVISAGIFDG